MNPGKSPSAALTAKGASKAIYYPGKYHKLQAFRQSSRDALDAAKARVGISDAWRALDLPGEPKRSCRSPLRDDKHPSFSISLDDQLWHDHGTGLGGDVVTFIQAALGCAVGEAIRHLREIAGGEMSISGSFRLRPASSGEGKISHPQRPLPVLTRPTFLEIQALADLRGFPSIAAFEIADSRGLLRMATMRDGAEQVRAWVLTDEAQLSAQARRLDGREWTRSGSKSLTLRADPDHVIGLAGIGDRPLICPAEGEPDTLAVLHFAFLAGIHNYVAPLCLTGASKRIPQCVLERLAGRQVRIFRQTDGPGHAGTLRWVEDLKAAGADVAAVSLDRLMRPDGAPCKDLADLARWPVESWVKPAEVELDADRSGSEGRTLGPTAPGYFDLWEGVRL